MAACMLKSGCSGPQISMLEILPSILSADFAHLARDVETVTGAGARTLHVDVMDGHFVPNITLGPPVVKSLRAATTAELDVHLMIENPHQYAPAFIKEGANRVSIHQEACVHLDRTLHMIRDHGAKAGVVLNPSTPVAALDDVLEIVDFVVVMSVNPGFGGQKFIPNAIKKVQQLTALRKERGLQFAIEIDGGVDLKNVGMLAGIGVDWLVAGSAIFHSVNPADTFRQMTQLAHDAVAVKV